MGSLIFYILIMLMVTFLMYVAQKKNNKKMIIIPIFLLAVVAGIRGSDVGVDTSNYIQIFDFYNRVGIGFVKRDFLFYYIAAFLMYFFNQPQIPLFAFALILYSLIILRLWDFRYSLDLRICSSLFFLYYFGSTMNGLRQMLAVAIIFYYSRYIKREKYKKYFIGVLIAALFHFSAVIAVVLPLIYMFIEKPNNPKTVEIMKKVLIAIVPIALIFIYMYSGYLDEINGIKIGFMATVRLVLFLVTYILYKKEVSIREGITLKHALLKKDAYTFISVLCLIGYLLSFCSSVVDFASRAGYYFRIYEIIFYAIIFCRTKMDRRVKCIIFTFLYGLGICYFWKYHGIIPYYTIFS